MNKTRKIEIEKDLLNGDARYKFITPPHSKSHVWQKFQIVQFEEKTEKFARCNNCKVLLAYSAECGTGSLLRHGCFRGSERSIRPRIKLSPKVKKRVLKKHPDAEATDLKPLNTMEDNEFYPSMYPTSLPASLQPYDMAIQKIEEPSDDDAQQESLLKELSSKSKDTKFNKNTVIFSRESSTSASTTNNNNQSTPIHHDNIGCRKQSVFKQKPVHEFDIFCSSLAIQLKKMPLRHALQCQDQIQTIVTRKRLALLDNNDEDPYTPALTYVEKLSHNGDDPLDDVEALSDVEAHYDY